MMRLQDIDTLNKQCAVVGLDLFLRDRGIVFTRLPEGEQPERTLSERCQEEVVDSAASAAARLVERLAASGLRRIACAPNQERPAISAARDAHGLIFTISGSWPIESE